MEQNFSNNISQIQLETSKAAAARIAEQWGGINSSRSSNSGSYIEDKKLNESVNNETNKLKSDKKVYSFGVLNTVLALKNSSMNEIPSAKIMLEKFENLLLLRGISEAFLIEGLLNELKGFEWEASAKEALANLNKIYEFRRREIEVVKAYETIKGAPGRELFSDATQSMAKWLVTENRDSVVLASGLRRWGFNPIVRNLVNFLGEHESRTKNSFQIKSDNTQSEVVNIYSPLLVEDSRSIFYTSGRFFYVNENELGALTEKEANMLPAEFVDKVKLINDPMVKIQENRVSCFTGKNKIDFIYEGEDKKVFFNGNPIKEEDLSKALSMSLHTIFEGSNQAINKINGISKIADELVDIDFGKKIVSRVYENVEANIFKVNGKIYVQTVNPSMKLNKVYEGNATQAASIIKEFIKFDISESLTEFLDREDAVRSVMYNDRTQISKNIEMLEGEIRKIDAAVTQNHLLNDSQEVKGLRESIETEIGVLRERWNKVNFEIKKFETSKNEITEDVNENVGYPIETEIRVLRNGSKGKIIGVDGTSRTYTVMMENGTTSEYFFGDVENTVDEVSHANLEGEAEETSEGLTPMAVAPTGRELKIKKDSQIEKKSKKLMAKAPGSSASGSSRFAENEKNHNLADVTNVKKTGKAGETRGAKKPNFSEAPSKEGKKLGGKFIQDLNDHNLAKATETNIKSASKFIDDLRDHNLSLSEGQKNKQIEKAPAPKTPKDAKKFVENEKHAGLAGSHGNSKKNGKKFVEDLKRAGLSSAPGKKRKTK
jgi:hypothetical protein